MLKWDNGKYTHDLLSFDDLSPGEVAVVVCGPHNEGSINHLVKKIELTSGGINKPQTGLVFITGPYKTLRTEIFVRDWKFIRLEEGTKLGFTVCYP